MTAGGAPVTVRPSARSRIRASSAATAAAGSSARMSATPFRRSQVVNGVAPTRWFALQTPVFETPAVISAHTPSEIERWLPLAAFKRP